MTGDRAVENAATSRAESDTVVYRSASGYICDGCRNHIAIGHFRCPLCGTVCDGVRHLAE